MLVLAGCQGIDMAPLDKNSDEQVEQAENNDNELEETEKVDLKDLGALVEATFEHPIAKEAWEHYVKINEELEYLEMIYDEEDNNGSSFEFIKDKLESMLDKATFEITELEIREGDMFYVFHYLDPEDNREMYNYADISFHTIEDKLYLSSISPGPFSVTEDDMLSLDDYYEYKYDIQDLIKNETLMLNVARYKMINNHNLLLMAPAVGPEGAVASYTAFSEYGEAFNTFSLDFNMVKDDFTSAIYSGFYHDLDARIKYLEHLN